VASVGMALTCLGLIFLSFLSAETSIPRIIGILVILGIGLALFLTPNINIIMGSVETRVYGVASAIVGTMRQIGQTLSMSITMVVLAFIVGNTRITSQNIGDFITSSRITYIIFVVLTLVGISASLARGKSR
jgi:hypothetical protein